MSNFFAEQVEHILFQIRCEIPSSDGGRIRRRLGTQAMARQARIYAETYFLYVAGKNPRRTPLSGKMAIYGWTIAYPSYNTANMVAVSLSAAIR